MRNWSIDSEGRLPETKKNKKEQKRGICDGKDLRHAGQCQIRTVWVAGEEHRSPDETMTVGDVRPDFVVASLAELPELIRRPR